MSTVANRTSSLDWVASSQDLSVDAYLAQHRQDTGISELKTYFTSVIDWVGGVFTRPPDKQMQGLEWGRLYELYHSTSYNAANIDARFDELLGDQAVKRPKGIYEFLLSGETKPELLEIRLFEDTDKRVAYQRQTKAKTAGESNCPHCAMGTDNNKARIYKQNEMDADHVTAWSKGGSTSLSNLTMLCVTRNRAKGNR